MQVGLSSINIEKLFLISALCVSTGIKLININSGGPQIEVDDYSLYDGAFLVWFGNAPPQHGYLESWLCGAICLFHYAFNALINHGLSGLWTVNFIENAYRDYYQAPEQYYITYRAFVLIVDLLTAVIIYKTARLVFFNSQWRYSALFVTVLYLFSYNTVWCGLVGRPDIFVSFFGVVGFYCYIKSKYQIKSPYIWCAAASFGIAAGLKLHGAFFTIFVCIDLIRCLGFRRNTIISIIVVVLISFLLFLLTSGTLLFDPLLYVKLRTLNYVDDISSYIKWGDQILVVLNGTGWIFVCITILLSLRLVTLNIKKEDSILRSTLLLSICWLLLFLSIRQLRAYWMLPALPLFYMFTAYIFSRIESLFVRRALTCWLILIFIFQSVSESIKISKGDHDQLRKYITDNIQFNQSFFVLGFSVLRLPRNSENIKFVTTDIMRGIEDGLLKNESFTVRHVKNWEENSQIKLFDMLNFQSKNGYTYFNFFEHKENFFLDLTSLTRIDYVILATKGFSLDKYPEIRSILQDQYVLVNESQGPGGGGYGIPYLIYKKR